ncbi:MAG TPA: LysR family transcriptional regulator [Trebonia sp.]
MISLRGLECLVAVVEQDSLTRAAAMLCMSQPALSQQIAAIERELGTLVIERLSRGIRPTRAGAAAAAEARIALAAVDRAVLAGRQVAAGAGGRIRVSCAEMTALILLPVLRDWRHRFPRVELVVREYATAELMLEAARSEEADLSVGPRLARSDQRVEVLGREEIVVVASAGHRLAGLAAVSRAELTIEPLVHYGPGEPVSGRGDRPASPAVRAGGPQIAAQLAASGMGVAVVPVSALTAVSVPGTVIRSLDPPERRDIVVSIAAPHDALLQRFVSDLKRCALPTPRSFEPSMVCSGV